MDLLLDKNHDLVSFLLVERATIPSFIFDPYTNMRGGDNVTSESLNEKVNFRTNVIEVEAE